MKLRWMLFWAVCCLSIGNYSLADERRYGAEIRTPPTPHSPRINGPDVFGVRPGNPFLYHIPASGDRPMKFSGSDLPKGLALDPDTGEITGMLETPGIYQVVFHARNDRGRATKKFKIVVGETISLTPAMGWNSWNHYAERITQALVVSNAQAMVDSGLINHGWSYINVDDTWQGARGGTFNAIQGDEKFPDIKAMCDAVHALGLKVGLYSTPWTTSYAGHIGGSSDNPEGFWTNNPTYWKSFHIGKYCFATNDAGQWAAWGVDYLKYDWNPIRLPETVEMADALRNSGRDIVFSLSNDMNVTNAATIGKIANSWRTTGDIKANWRSLVRHCLAQVPWVGSSSPGHWNDPDMLEIGTKEQGEPGLKPNEEYLHMTMWCLLASPLLLGNDLTKMDAFTLNLLENDEVLAVDQDELGRQAAPISAYGQLEQLGPGAPIHPLQVWARPLADGSHAVGLLNFGETQTNITVKWADVGISGRHRVRDLWREKNLGRFKGEFSMPVAPHSAELIKISG